MFIDKTESQSRQASAQSTISADWLTTVKELASSTPELNVALFRPKASTLPFALSIAGGVIVASALSTVVGNFWLLAITLSLLGMGIASIIVRKSTQADHMKKLLTGYLGKEVARDVIAERSVNDRPRVIYGTVLFADIRAFTKMTESADKVQLFRELNIYYDVVDTAITAFNGTINKFGGDSALALFGAAQRRGDHASAALNAAAAIIDGLAELNHSRSERGLQPFRVGIGIHSGEMVVGHLGSRRRREYTVIGDCVNVASRLSDLSKESPFYSIFVGRSTMENITHLPSSLVIDELGDVEVRGRDGVIQTCAVTPLISRKPSELRLIP